MHPWLSRTLLLMGLAGILVQPAYGYIDPGTGSYILQLLIGAVLGGIFTLVLFWKKTLAALRRLFTRNRRNNTPGV